MKMGGHFTGLTDKRHTDKVKGMGMGVKPNRGAKKCLKNLLTLKRISGKRLLLLMRL